MLFKFRFRNFKSFKDEVNFSMIPAPKQKGLDYSLLKESIAKKEYKALCSSIIYGPNASGKSNIIQAFDVFKRIVLNGSLNISGIEYVPNCYAKNCPTYFEITFIHKNRLYNYSLLADLGSFKDIDSERKVIEEKLCINNKTIFIRNDNLEVFIPGFLKDDFKPESAKLTGWTMNRIKTETLFLTNDFKTYYSDKTAKNIIDWFKNYLNVSLSCNLLTLDNHNIDLDIINKLLQEFGIKGNTINLRKDNKGNIRLYSQINGIEVPAEDFESYGTIRFIQLLPMIINALRTGGTLIVDEFDASIHPSTMFSLLLLFHNYEVNVNKAQFILNCLNPIYLDSSLFRRDEIKFTDFGDDTNILYSLSDFRTADGIRKGEDYMTNYLKGRYGALKYNHFTDIMKALFKKENS